MAVDGADPSAPEVVSDLGEDAYDGTLAAEPLEANSNGATRTVSAEQHRAALAQLTSRLGEVVTLLLATPRYRHLAIQDLEWLVMAPLMKDQLLVASASVESSEARLAGVVLTARVSEEVDRRIREQIKAGVFPVRLRPQDWASGEIAWILDVIAPSKQIATRLFSGVARSRFDGTKLSVHPFVSRLVDPEALKVPSGDADVPG